MKRFNILDENGNAVMQVEAATSASAKMMAKRQGWKGFCTAEEANRADHSVPGKIEYETLSHYFMTCDNIARENAEMDRRAAGDILGTVSGLNAPEYIPYPAFPLSEAETGLAKQYARFLGDVPYRELLERLG